MFFQELGYDKALTVECLKQISRIQSIRKCDLPEAIQVVKKLKTKYSNVLVQNIGNSVGKLAPLDVEEENKMKAERIRSWLLTKNENFVGLRAKRIVEDGVRKVADSINNGIVESELRKFSFREWIKLKWTWANRGASNDVTEFDIPDVKNKWNTALTKSNRHLFSMVKYYMGLSWPGGVNGRLEYKKNDTKIDLKLVAKPESEKVRYVISDNVYSYICSSYVFYFLDKGFSRVKEFFPFLNKKSQDRRLVKFCNDLGVYKGLDLDYSTWDESITLDSIYYALKSLRDNVFNKEYFKFKFGDNPYLVMSSIMDKVYNYRVFEPESNRYKNIVNGLISGSRYTTSINTLIHYAIIVSSNEGREVVDFIVNGDDMHASVKSIDAVKNLNDKFVGLGFVVNESKTHFGSNNEFLKINLKWRRLPYSNPERMFGSVLWSISDERSMSIEEQIETRIDNWAKISGRFKASYRKDMEKAPAITDIHRTLIHHGITGYSRRDILNYLSTPKIVGGGGLFINNDRSDWLSIKIERSYHYNINEINEMYSKVKENTKWDKLRVSNLIGGESFRRSKLDNVSRNVNFDFEHKTGVVGPQVSSRNTYSYNGKTNIESEDAFRRGMISVEEYRRSNEFWKAQDNYNRYHLSRKVLEDVRNNGGLRIHIERWLISRYGDSAGSILWSILAEPKVKNKLLSVIGNNKIISAVLLVVESILVENEETLYLLCL